MQCSDGSLAACLARHGVQRPAARRPPSPGNRAGCTAAPWPRDTSRTKRRSRHRTASAVV
ncbi:hypothetical protein XMIN_2196 [Xanthomonas citri pv. mangiferaeindicae LMG 941]|nr:hypothetical protein XMIN_2196 [Xanthomonas citri pv. mangiferaeindicae LMG 941]